MANLVIRGSIKSAPRHTENGLKCSAIRGTAKWRDWRAEEGSRALLPFSGPLSELASRCSAPLFMLRRDLGQVQGQSVNMTRLT